MAFFCFWTAFLFVFNAQSQSVNHCHAPDVNDYIGVKQVIDGDTLVFDGDITIRLVGIDTPEIDYETGRSEPLAEAARSFLESLLKGVERLGVVYDEETRDQYGRTLAHLFLPDGSNIQRKILMAGLAVPFSYPPNLLFTGCYYEAAGSAQKQRLGLWSLPRYAPVAAIDVAGETPGYRVITGQITEIIDSKRLLTIVMDARVSVIVPREMVNFFISTDINRLSHYQIKVHGYLYNRHGNYGLRIHHPSQIELQ